MTGNRQKKTRRGGIQDVMMCRRRRNREDGDHKGEKPVIPLRPGQIKSKGRLRTLVKTNKVTPGDENEAKRSRGKDFSF